MNPGISPRMGLSLRCRLSVPSLESMILYGAVGLAGVLSSRSSHAYIPTVTPSGKSVLWGENKAHLNLAGNPVNQSGLSDSQVFDAVVHGLERWQAASGGTVGFDYWQGSDPKIYEPNSAFNGLNSIYFSSNGHPSPSLTANVLGLTQVWYDSDSGRILETDIVLNDENFDFTTDEKDTSGYGTGAHALGTSDGKPRVFIENVITHEIGHALGLSHSAGLQSTMLFMESPEQAHLGCDEQVGINALYKSGDAGSRGSISGTVRSDGGKPLLGAHVLAISRARGVVLATALTDKNGKYEISALEPGVYFLMVEPYFAGPGPLPGYYSSLDLNICSNRPFGRSFLMDGSSVHLAPVDVAPGHAVQPPDLIAHCAEPESAGAMAPRFEGSSADPEIDLDGEGFGIVDRLDSSLRSKTYKLSGLSGHVEIHAVAYSLYSPIQAGLRLLDGNGDEVPAQVESPSFEGKSGYKNFDATLITDNLIPGDYTLEVKGDPLDASLYPAGTVSLDSVPFLVITGSLSIEQSAPLADALAANSRCEANEKFTPYSSPAGNPPRSNTSQSSGGSIGFCGTSKSSDSREKGIETSQILGWLLPWLFTLGGTGAAKVFFNTRVRQQANRLRACEDDR